MLVGAVLRDGVPQVLRDREPFAAYVAHELRTPITLQRALVEVALADPHADTTALRAMGEGVLASCDEQQRLIDALLDLTRNQCPLTRSQPVDIAAITNQALRAHDLSEFDSIVTIEPARTTGDPDLVERLAANLVSNATRHNITGGRIEVATRTEAEHAVLSVANTGRLIPPGELTRLFQPFQRLGPQPQACADGVGLGLAIVQAIADAHDAIVTAHTRAGGGLKIDVKFPATMNTPGARSGEQLRATTSPRFGVSRKATAEAFSTHPIVSA
jgi:signal transduction histidine kinase